MFLKLTQNNGMAIWNANCGVESVNGTFEQIIQEFHQKFRVFQIVSYQLKYISNDPPTHGGLYLDSLEQFGVSFETFEKIPRNVPCFADSVILGEASLLSRIMLRLFGVVSKNLN